MKLAPEEALVAATANAAHVLGRGDRIGRLRPGFAADIVLLDAPDWRHVAYHLAGDVVHTVVEARSGGVQADGIIPGMATQKQRRRRAKEKRHEYDLVYVDEDGVEQVSSATSRGSHPQRRARRAGAKTASKSTSGRRGREVKPPSWQQGPEARGRSSPRSSSPR